MLQFLALRFRAWPFPGAFLALRARSSSVDFASRIDVPSQPEKGQTGKDGGETSAREETPVVSSALVAKLSRTFISCLALIRKSRF